MQKMLILFLCVAVYSKSLLIYDEGGVSNPGWGRGKASFTTEESYSGDESLLITSPGWGSGGGVVKYYFNTIDFLLDRSYLEFYLKKKEGRAAEDLNIVLRYKHGHCNYTIKPDFKEADSKGWVKLSLPICKFRNIENFDKKTFNLVVFTSHKGSFYIDKITIKEGKPIDSDLKLEIEDKFKKFSPTGKNYLRLKFKLSHKSKLNFTVFNEKKDEVFSFKAKDFKPGENEIIWDGRDAENVLVPNGLYSYLIDAYRRENESLLVKSTEGKIEITGMPSEYDLELVSKLPRRWPTSTQLDKTKFKLTPTFKDMTHILKTENVDVLPTGIILSSSHRENIAKRISVEVSSPNACITPLKTINDGYPFFHFHWKGNVEELKLKFRFVMHKIINKIGIQMLSKTKFKKLKLTFKDHLYKSENVIVVELQDTSEMQYSTFTPTMANVLEIEPIELKYGWPRNEIKISEFEVYEATKMHSQGYFITEDIVVPKISRWIKFVPNQIGNGIEWFYSVNSGAEWIKVPKSGNIKNALRKDILPHRIRFKAVLSSKDNTSPMVKGFSLTYEVDYKLPIQEPIHPEDRIIMKNGMFYTARGKRIGFFGTSFDIHSYLWNWWGTDWEKQFERWKRTIDLVALYGMNVVRLAYAATFFNPRPGIFPEDKEFENTMREYEKWAKEGYRRKNLKYYQWGNKYLEFMDRIINYSAERGIYTILDWHGWPTRWEWGEKEITPEEKVEGLVKLWRYLAKRYKNNHYVIGFDIPYNEPTKKPWMDNNFYYNTNEKIIKAIKEIDKEKLIFLEIHDWGHHCDVAEINPVACFDYPKYVDAVYPHYYLGIHSPNTDPEEAYKGWLANWLSWFQKPTIIGEWNSSHELRGGCGTPRFEPGFDPVVPDGTSRCLDAHISYFYAQGVALTNQWAWYGDPWARKGADTVLKFISFCKEHPPLPYTKSEVALVCNSHYRTNYGQKRDLQLIVDELLDCHILPFRTIFEKQIKSELNVLKKYKALIVYTKGMEDETLKIIKESKIPAFYIPETSPGKEYGLKSFLRESGIFVDDRTSKELLIAYGENGFLIFERYGKSGVYNIHPRINKRGKIVIRDYETKKVMIKGSAKKIYKKGFKVYLKRNRAKLYEY